MRLLFIILIAGNAYAASLIPSDRLVTWTPNVTVGAIGGPVTRTDLIDITAAPYNAPVNDGGDAAPALQAAINAATSNQVVYLPAGRYVLSNSIFCNNPYITIRGAGATNTIVFSLGNFWIGADTVNYLGLKTDVITNGATKGSTTLTFQDTPTVNVGNVFTIGALVEPTDNFQVTSLGVPVYGVQYPVLVTGKSGREITLAAPLMFDLTNQTFGIKPGPNTYHGIGLENLTITGTNDLTGDVSTAIRSVLVQNAANCWITGCHIEWARNFSLVVSDSAHITIRNNSIQHAQGSGPNHAGLIIGAGHCLIEDTIFANGLQPAIEFNGGGYNAFFACFFTNNLIDIDSHGPHPMMYLFEQNVVGTYPVDGIHYGGSFILDGYYGSASHQTLFRNAIYGVYTPVYLKRWSSYAAIVGNVLGSPIGTYSAFSHDTSGVTEQIVEWGRPNIGNNVYTGENPPLAWNFPGSTINVFGWGTENNGTWVTTNETVIPPFTTTDITGDWSKYPPGGAIVFQDNNNTNKYWPRNGYGLGVIGTPDNTKIRLQSPSAASEVVISNGWRAYYVNQINDTGYQQLLTTNRGTHIITCNYDYYNDAQMCGANSWGDAPVSYLYTSAPSWWSVGLRYPAVQPDSGLLVTRIPAQERYEGIFAESGGTPRRVTNLHVNRLFNPGP